MVAQHSYTTTTYGPALQKMMTAFPQAKEQSNGWWSHADNPTFDFRENEDGSISIHSWTGRTQQEILAMGGLQIADMYPRGYKTVKVRAKLDVMELAHAKCIPWQFLLSLGLQSDYRYHGYSDVKIPYFNVDGTQHTKIRVRKAIEGDYKQCWDENTPGDILPYGLDKLAMAREAGYGLLGEGESDGWACWFNNVPYLGIPGADMHKTLKHLDINLLPPKIYILLEPDQKQKLLDNGKSFYKNIHSTLRAMNYQGEIFCIDFKKSTGHKDPSELHIALWKAGKTEQFKECIHQALEQAIPANDMQDETPTFAIQDARVLEALVERKLQALYALAPEITDMPDMEQATIKLAAKDIWKNDFPSREFDNLLKAAKAENIRKRQPQSTPISLYDLRRKHFDPIKYIVPDILPAGLIILGGKQKIGKSWLDLNLGIAVATGGVALGHYKVEQGDVLYMALEDTDRRLQDRTGQLLAPGEEWPKNMEVVTEWPRMNEGGLEKLEAWIQARPNARLVIADPWVKIKPRLKSRHGETGYDADYEALEGVKKLADKYGICILVQFHLRKANADDPFDEVNATTGVTACADGFISLKRSRGESEATLYASGRDYKEEVNLALSFKSGMWKVLGEGQTAVYYGLSQERRAVIDLLCEAITPMMPKDIATLLAVNDGTMRKLLFSMKDDNQVEWKEEDKERKLPAGYISCIPSPKQENQNNGNGGNGGNGGNTVTVGTPLPDRSDSEIFTNPSETSEGEKEERVTSVTAVTDVTDVTALPQENDVIPMDLLQECRELYARLQQVPAEKLAPHGTLMWHVPDSGISNEMITSKQYGIRLHALLKSGELRKIRAGREEMLRKLSQLK
jgi:hypothetical protein